MKEKSRIDWKCRDIAIVKAGVDHCGIMFNVLGPAVFLKQWWVPIEDPDEDDPTFFKESCLELFEPGDNYIPTILRPVIEKESRPKETKYAIGQLEEDANEIGMWDGPNPNLLDLLEVPGRDVNSVIVKFAPDGDSLVYRWYPKGNCWRKVLDQDQEFYGKWEE